MTPDQAAALYRAMKSGDRASFQELLRLGGFETSGAGPIAAPLIAAVFCERPDFLRELLAAGADVNYRDTSEQGSSFRLRALEAALWQGEDEMVEIISDAGACEDFGTLVFQANAKAVDAELERDPTLCNSAYIHPHFTLLHVAADIDAADLIRVLVAHGLDPNARDADGHAPLRYAARNSPCIDVCEALLDAGADVNAVSETGITALSSACRHEESLPTIEFLLTRGADPNLVPKNRVSPLMKAAANRSVRSVALLIEHGADPDFVGKNGESALDVARRRKATEVVRRLA